MAGEHRDESKAAAPGGGGQGARSESSPQSDVPSGSDVAADYRSDFSPTPSDTAESTDASNSGDEGEESPVQKLERERDEYLDLAQRARAELENYRKRTAGELTAADRRGREAVAREILPALDNLERALLAAGVEAEPGAVDERTARGEEASASDAFAQGVELVFRELRAAIARAGITELDPTGERFDPNRHEAVAKQPADGAESGTVIETLQRGYLLGDHAIRPARVIVAA